MCRCLEHKTTKKLSLNSHLGYQQQETSSGSFER